MTHVYSQQIDDIIKSNKVFRFVAELEETTDKSRCKQIKKLLHQEQSIKNPQKLKEEKMNHHLKILRFSQYQKRWQYLNLEQKLNRVDEFIERNAITDEELTKRLIQYVNDGFIKTKNITYDIAKGHITDIDVLTKEENEVEDEVEGEAEDEGDRDTVDVYVLKNMTPRKKGRSKSKSDTAPKKANKKTKAKTAVKANSDTKGKKNAKSKGKANKKAKSSTQSDDIDDSKLKGKKKVKIADTTSDSSKRPKRKKAVKGKKKTTTQDSNNSDKPNKKKAVKGAKKGSNRRKVIKRRKADS